MVPDVHMYIAIYVYVHYSNGQATLFTNHLETDYQLVIIQSKDLIYS